MKITLTKHDLAFFKALFDRRCLSLMQAYKYFFKNHYKDFRIFYTEYIIPMCRSGLLQIQSGSLSGYCVAITQGSLNLLVKYQFVSLDIWDASRKCVIHGIKSINDIVLSDRLIDHQVEMNEFLLRFSSLYPQTGPKFEILDEKYCSYFSIIRPDSLIRIGEIDLFVEQDMGTESSKQLNDKWNKYRRFLTQEFDHKRRIVILFIIKSKDGNEKKRINLVKRSLMNVFSSFLADSVDIFIGTKEELLRVTFKKVLSGSSLMMTKIKSSFKKHDFDLYSGQSLKVALEGSVYQYYISKVNENKALLRYKAYGQMKYQEFLVDEYYYKPFSVLSKIAFHERNSTDFDIAYSFKHPNQRKISYIVIAKSLQEISQDMELLNLWGTEGVFITTFARLNTMPLEQAVIWIAKNGEAYNCKDPLFVPNNHLGHINNLDAGDVA